MPARAPPPACPSRGSRREPMPSQPSRLLAQLPPQLFISRSDRSSASRPRRRRPCTTTTVQLRAASSPTPPLAVESQAQPSQLHCRLHQHHHTARCASHARDPPLGGGVKSRKARPTELCPHVAVSRAGSRLASLAHRAVPARAPSLRWPCSEPSVSPSAPPELKSIEST